MSNITSINKCISLLQAVIIEERNNKNSDTHELFEHIKENFINMSDEIEFTYSEAKDSYEDMKNNGLTFCTLEAEGYLRGIGMIRSIVESYRESYIQDIKDIKAINRED